MSYLAFSNSVMGTSLDDYVAARDPAYAYTLVQTVTHADYSCYSIKMTSLRWRSPAEVNHTVWEHWLTIIKPQTHCWHPQKALSAITFPAASPDKI